MEEHQTSITVFLDASVLVAAALSQGGGSFRIVTEATIRRIIPVTSRYAYREAERTLENKYPVKLIKLAYAMSFITLVPDAPETVVQSVLPLIDFKDAPILAAALMNKSTALVTLDKTHFIENQVLKQQALSIEFLLPGDFIKTYFL